jgi:hypothetical protein
VGLVSRLSRLRTLVVAGIATAVFVAALSELPRLFDIELAFTAGGFRQTLTAWAQELASSPVGHRRDPRVQNRRRTRFPVHPVVCVFPGGGDRRDR